MIHKNCVVCGKDIIVYPYQLKKRKEFTCSYKCRNIFLIGKHTKGKYKKCERCGKDFWHRPSENRRGSVRKYCSLECCIPTKRGEAMSTDGYFIINHKKVHRIIMEEHIGRRLKSSEIVHHKDFNKLNNDISNLQIVTRAEHNRIHQIALGNIVK